MGDSIHAPCQRVTRVSVRARVTSRIRVVDMDKKRKRHGHGFIPYLGATPLRQTFAMGA